MKYIKTFEAKKEYKIGDTVVFKMMKMQGKFDIKVGVIKEPAKEPFENWWIITDLDNRIYKDLTVRKSYILKKANKKDIDKYMMEPTLNKFNI